MDEIRAPLIGTWERSPEVLPLGLNHNESGTLRMGTEPNNSMTDELGKVRDLNNLYVADAWVFPSVGIANPMLTITAFGYRVSETICEKLHAMP